jgi:UDPglucose 6-dehydrogenase
MDVNAAQKTKLIARVKEHFKGNLKGKTIAMWGLSFKPHTDDIREAPALYNIDELLKEGAIVKAHDPEAMEHVKRILGDKIQYYNTPYEAAENADAIFIATEWPEFRTPDFEKLSSIVKSKVIFDGRNVYDLDVMKEHGYTYFSIGREAVNVGKEVVHG